MKIRNQNIDPASQIGRERIPVAIVTAVSLTDAVVYSLKPAHRFQLVSVRTFCRTKTGAVAGVIKCGTRTAATLTFTAATEVASTLSTTKANIRGSATETITIEITTDGTGALTNGHVIIEYRAFPMAGDLNYK